MSSKGSVRRGLDSDMKFNIRVLSSVNHAQGFSEAEIARARELASTLRRGYKSNNDLSPKALVATKIPVKIDTGYVKKLLADHPTAGWGELSRLARRDGRIYSPQALSYHVVNVIGKRRTTSR